MNINILYIALLYCAMHIPFTRVYGQHCSNTINTISTDWRNFPATSQNDWNWTSTEVQSIYRANGLPVDDLTQSPDPQVARVFLPYFCPNQIGAGSCQNPNTLAYELLPAAEQDILPENGWELLAKNFGTPTRNGVTGKGAPGHPFFMLYNRHTGVVKIFILRYGDIPNIAANDVFIDVKFTKKDEQPLPGQPARPTVNGTSTQVKRNLFGFADHIVKPNEEMDVDNFSRSRNYYANPTNPYDHYWLVANLVTLYDPCTCENFLNKFTLFNVELNLTSISNLRAEINGQISSEPAGHSSGDVENPLSPVNDFFSKYGGYIDKLRDIIVKSPTKKRQEIADKWFKAERGEDAFVASNASDRLNQLNNAIGVGAGNISPTNLENVAKFSKFIGTVETVASIFPYVSAALGVVNMFMGSEEAPNVSYVNLQLKGTLETPIPTPTPAFYLPGSANQNGQSGLKPIYNNTLGVFNILKAPKVEYANIRNNCERGSLDRKGIDFNERDYSGNFDRMENEQFLKQYRLKDDIKYVINPASGMEVKSIEACFVTELSGAEAFFNPGVGQFETTTQTPVFFGEWTTSWFHHATMSDELKAFGWDLEYVTEGFVDFRNEQGYGDRQRDKEFIRYRTQYVPLQCLKNINFLMFGSKRPRMYIKMVIKLGYEGKPAKEPITHVVTYDITKSFEPDNLINSGLTGEVNTTIYYETLPGLVMRNLGNTFIRIPVPAVLFTNPGYMGHHFRSPLPFPNPYYDIAAANQTYISGQRGTRIINGDFTIPAGSVVPANTIFRVSGKVDIGAGVIFGDNVEIYSGTEINNDPDNTYNPNLTLIIEGNTDALFFPCTPRSILNNKATDAEITAMCSSQPYRGRAYPTKSDTDEEPEKVEIDDRTTTYPLTAAPNPFNEGGVRIDFGLEQAGRCMVTVHDMLGKQVAVLLSTDTAAEGPQQLFWDAADAPMGIYIVTLHTEQGRQSIKVSKQ